MRLWYRRESREAVWKSLRDPVVVGLLVVLVFAVVLFALSHNSLAIWSHRSSSAFWTWGWRDDVIVIDREPITVPRSGYQPMTTSRWFAFQYSEWDCPPSNGTTPAIGRRLEVQVSRVITLLCILLALRVVWRAVVGTRPGRLDAKEASMPQESL